MSAIIGAAVGIAYPFVDVAVSCRTPDSEACVWGKAYFLLTLVVSVPLIGAVAAAAAYAFLGWASQDEPPKGDGLHD